jgi:hypothetical protein
MTDSFTLHDDSFTLQLETSPNVWEPLTSWNTESGVRDEMMKQRRLYPEDRYRIVQNVGYEKVIYPVNALL